MRTIKYIIILCLVICVTSSAQVAVQRLDSMPKEFAERYLNQYHEYNPLHVGDLWQFANYLGGYNNREIVKDTLVNGTKYYKKLEFQYPIIPDYYYWERNDSSNRAVYSLDIQDLDEDGDTLDELLLDSLEVIDNTQYTSYRYTWKPWDPDPKTVLVFDSLWITVFGDAVIARLIEYIPPFQDELVADKYGVVAIYPEGSPPLLLTGMIINGIKYGTIISVEDENDIKPPKEFLLNNYPNPFNPQTIIKYYLPERLFVKLKVIDLLGKEIKILVDEELDIGYHEITFNSSGLPSGVYFYTLQTPKFAQTKKMILLK